MRVYLQRYKEHVAAAARWKRMGDLIRDCLLELRHQVIDQEWAPDAPEDLQGAEFLVFPHLGRRERPDGNLFFKEMHIPWLFTLDSQGWGVDHSGMKTRPELSGITPEAAAAQVSALREMFLTSGQSRLPQPALSDTPPEEGFILVPLQRPRDYVLTHNSPISVLDFLHTVADWAEHRGQRVAIKLHPANDLDPEIVEAARQRTASSRFVSLCAGNIHRLISASRGVFVINSSTGFESLLHGKPVATFGRCDYKWVTFDATPDNLDQAAAYLDHYTEAQRREAYRFVCFYHWQHAYNVSDGFAADSKLRLRSYLAAATASLPR
jgi:hypothetical protein